MAQEGEEAGADAVEEQGSVKAPISREDAFAAMGSDVAATDQPSEKARKEENAVVDSENEDEAGRQQKLQNDSDEQDMGERKRYANHAYAITQAWVGFLIVVTIAQMALKPLGMDLETPEYITFVTTTTASVFGFWLLVGNYLFRKP